MADKAQKDEPSIEEILDSIRQIISEDSSDAAAEEDEPAEEIVEEVAAEEPVAMDQSAIDDMDFDAPMPAAEPEPEESADASAADIDDIFAAAPQEDVFPDDSDEDDVIDLVESVEEPLGNIEIDMADGDDDSADEIDEILKGMDSDVIDDEPEPVQEPKEEIPMAKVSEPVSSDETLLTRGAEEAAVSAISELVRKTAVEHQGITLEDIVRSELKPLLRAWLDKNLPIVIERLVREELERVTKRVLED